MAKNALGRNFYDIIGDNMPEERKGNVDTIRIADIEPRKDQPRKNFERESLEALADSISKYGVLQPIIVRENSSLTGLYEIVAGERRWRAAKLAGLSEIPAVVFSGDELKTAQVSLVENLQREDLNPIEEALAYERLIDNFGLTQEAVAKEVGKSRSAIANALRLLDLPKEVLEMLKTGELSAGHARALLGLDDEKDILPLAEKITNRDLSVREVEAAVRKLNAKEHFEAPVNLADNQVKLYMKELENRARESLGRRVKISHSNKKKSIEIEYETNDDLEALLKTLCGDKFFDNI